MVKQTLFFCFSLFLFTMPFSKVHADETVATELNSQQQGGTCSGIVKSTSGETIIGASVKVKGTNNGKITDINGAFSLKNVKKGATIVISYVGYKTIEVKYSGRSLNVVLEEDSKTLGEVVVTALGIQKQARSVGYATTKVDPNELERASAMSPVNALIGKVAGVTINLTGASGLTSSSSITIRGAKSLSKNNSPIFVVDGMIIQEAITGALSGTDWGSQLKNLNPADYESVTVLKGAAATALYGSRGANGAVVIVSKGGKYGKQGLGVEFSQTLETTDIYKSPIALQNEYGAGSPGNGFDGGYLSDGTLQKTAYSWGPKMDGSMVDQYMPGGEKTPFVAHPDNWRKLYDNGLNSTTNFAVSGGGENSSFRVSYSYTDNKGVFKRNEFKRHSISFKGLTELNKVFSVEVGLNYAFSRSQNGASQGAWNWGGNLAMMSTYYTPRNFDMSYYVDHYRNPETHAVETDTPWGTLRGYLHGRDMNLNQRDENSLLTNLKLSAKIMPHLAASLKANYNYYGISTLQKNYGTGANYGPTGSGYYGRGGSNSGSYNFLGMLQSNDNVIKIGGEKFTLDAFVAAELYGNMESHSWSKGTSGGLVVPGVFAFSNSVSTIIPSYNYSPRNSQTFGLSAVVNLNWRDQVFLELTGRNDWLSSLAYPSYIKDAKNNYTVFYPSANLSWVFTDTFKMPKWFSFGKIRASYSQVGMGTESYETTKGYGVFTQGQQYDSKRNSVLIANPNLGTAYNRDLKPEIQKSIELGADLRFFDERLTLDFAYYKTNTENQILSLPGVAEAGASTEKVNAGNIQNSGIEIQLEGTPIRNSSMRWTIGSTFTTNHSKVKKLTNFSKEWNILGQYDAGPEIWAYEGGDFGVITTSYANPYGPAIYRFSGEAGDPRNGKPVIKYTDTYGSPNPVYTYGYVTNIDKGKNDRVVLGHVEPNFLASVYTSFSYKDFDFYASADGRFGGNYFSHTYKYASSRGVLKSSLVGRDKEHGGIARTNFKGETVYDGIMLDAVFDEGTKAPLVAGGELDVSGMTYKEAVDKGIQPVMSSVWQWWNYGWGMPSELGIQKNTWFCLREITIGYRLPQKICRKFGANYLRIGLTARNICYLINKLTDGMNPEALSSNNSLTPMDIGGVPFSRTYALNLTLRF